MIEERSIAVAVCDACGHKDYANEQGEFFGSNGYSLTVVEHRTNTRHEAVACRETHIGKAARGVLERWHTSPWNDPIGTLVPPPDAPPLPRIIGDTQEVTQ